MERLNLEGWLPIRVWQQAGEWQVDWCWFGDTPLHQPFFRDAVEEALQIAVQSGVSPANAVVGPR